MSNQIDDYINLFKQYNQTLTYVNDLQDGYIKSKLSETLKEIKNHLDDTKATTIMNLVTNFVYYSHTKYNYIFDSLLDNYDYLIHLFLLYDQWTFKDTTMISTIDEPVQPETHAFSMETCHYYSYDNSSLSYYIRKAMDNTSIDVCFRNENNKDSSYTYTFKLNTGINTESNNLYERYLPCEVLYDDIHHFIKSIPKLTIPSRSSYSSINKDNISPPSLKVDTHMNSFAPPVYPSSINKPMLYPNNNNNHNHNPFDSDRLPGCSENGGSLFGPNAFKSKPSAPDNFPPGSLFDPYGPTKNKPIWPAGIKYPPQHKKPTPYPYKQLNPDNFQPPEDYDYTYF